MCVRTMLNHLCAGPESSRICVRRMAATRGRQPNVMVSVLYFPFFASSTYPIKSRSDYDTWSN